MGSDENAQRQLIEFEIEDMNFQFVNVTRN